MNFISRLDVNFLDSTQNIDKVSGALIEGQGHRVKVPASRVCQGQLLCKVSSSQLTLLQRNELNFLIRRKFSRLDAKCQWSVKSRSRAPGQGACLKSVKDNYYARFHLHS